MFKSIHIDLYIGYMYIQWMKAWWFLSPCQNTIAKEATRRKRNMCQFGVSWYHGSREIASMTIMVVSMARDREAECLINS